MIAHNVPVVPNDHLLILAVLFLKQDGIIGCAVLKPTLDPLDVAMVKVRSCYFPNVFRHFGVSDRLDRW